MIKAVIYDMDGVLIDSEPLWTIAESYGFGEVGIKLTDELRKDTRGLREDQVVDYWFDKFPWENKPKQDVLNSIIARIIELIWETGKPNDGVYDSINFFLNKGLKLAVASSSYESIIDAVLSKFKIRDKFEIIYSAEYEQFGKPHPGVYLTTAKKLKVNPLECLCIEDSLNGLNSAKAANMKCIAIPDKFLKGDHRFSKADLILNSLKEIDDKLWAGLY